jgi:hypothetical protein
MRTERVKLLSQHRYCSFDTNSLGGALSLIHMGAEWVLGDEERRRRHAAAIEISIND